MGSDYKIFYVRQRCLDCGQAVFYSGNCTGRTEERQEVEGEAVETSWEMGRQKQTESTQTMEKNGLSMIRQMFLG